MIKIENKFTVAEMTTEKLLQIVSEKLNIETKFENCEIEIDHSTYIETMTEQFELKTIVLNVTVDLNPTSDEYDCELIQITLNAENQLFNDEFEIENYIDEIVQNLVQ